ncbi:regucalcin-like isoform X2 [Bacillus rossius redtenbacheri]|uniref:regucalcin-like isoform X2 n=1 Tax=Bacillus rossius redtenbacheri TaxID=93214 RepID=UPI002FDE53E7
MANIFLILTLVLCDSFAVKAGSVARDVKTEVVTPALKCGEGPHWSSSEKVLYMVDTVGEKVLRYDPATNTTASINIGGGQVTFIVPMKGDKNTFLISIQQCLNILTWHGRTSDFRLKQIACVENDKPGHRLNDGKADCTGRLWTGTIGNEISQGVFESFQGALYSVENTFHIIRHYAGISISNGIAWSPDHRTMYFIDSDAYRVYAFDFNSTSGHVSNMYTLVDFKKQNISGFPDSMTVDRSGSLFVACYGGQQVIRVDPSNGRVLQEIKIPALDVTNVVFGGSNLDELYVTTASERASEEDKKRFPLTGHTFRLTGLGFQGLPEYEFVYNPGQVKKKKYGGVLRRF